MHTDFHQSPQKIFILRTSVLRPAAAFPKYTLCSLLIRSIILDCFDFLMQMNLWELWIDSNTFNVDRLTLRLNLDSVVRLTQLTKFLGVTIHFLLFWKDSNEMMTLTRGSQGFYKKVRSSKEGGGGGGGARVNFNPKFINGNCELPLKFNVLVQSNYR